jgi:uncharacterized NAD(P)/FAD-binding protein YdhS
MRGAATVVVVGGGCSGTLLAAELIRTSSVRPCKVVLVDPCESPGRGVAYGTSCSSHLLNVPAEQMSAYPDRPGDFVAWAQERDPRASALSFAPRMLYGDYLHNVWREAQAGAIAGSSLVHVRSRAIAVEPDPDGGVMRVGLENGESVTADHVVLAMGNLPPCGAGPLRQGVLTGDRYVADPWRPGALDGVSGTLLLIGTGLTAIDVALALDDRGVAGPIHAVSRHGLLPRAHRSDALRAQPAGALPTERTVRGLIGRLRRNAEECGDWRFAIDGFRPHVSAVWHALPDDERRRFLRHAARFWEIHRHRMAPEIAARVERLITVGWLSVGAGMIESFRETTAGVEVGVRHRGCRAAGGVDVDTFDHVINCTGPALAITAAGDPFVNGLLAAGLVRPGPYGLGFDVAEDGAIVDAQGIRSGNIWAIGPLRRGVDWETTAAREIRAQAVALAPLLSRIPSAAEATATTGSAVQGVALAVLKTMAGGVAPADMTPAGALP